MGNSKVKFSNVCYVITGISIILIIAILSNYFRDIKSTSREVKKEIQITGAHIASEYMYDFFEGRKASLSLLGKCITNLEAGNGTALEEKLSSESDLFDNIMVIGKNGSFIGGYGECESNGISEENAFKEAAEGNCIVAEELRHRNDGEKELLIYAPVFNGRGGVRAVLAASLLESTLNRYMEEKIAGSGIYAVVMNSTGRIIYGSIHAREVAGSPETSFFSFIKAECKIYTGNAGTDYVQEKMRARNDIFLEYNYGGKKFTATCTPFAVNNCYIVYITDISNSVIENNALSFSGTVLLKLLIADLLVIFAILLYNIMNHSKIVKLIDNYKVLDQQEGSVLFEYTFRPKRIEIFGDFRMITGESFSTLVGEAVYDIYEYVHEDDSSIRGRLHTFFDSDEKIFSSEVRIAYKNGEYGWFRLTGTIFRDIDGVCERFVGKIVNANKQISMEKNLVQRAENDLLTGVLNKKTMEAKITEKLKDTHEGRNYIFFMVDLDNFKNVNDTLGHISGDKAIADTAKALTEIFHSNAFVGRLGGDEFAVCVIYDAFDEESLMKFIIKNAEKICEANRREYSDGANTVKISSSVGISISPKDGNTFELLYKKADEALYNSKNTGKNKYTIFERKKSEMAV